MIMSIRVESDFGKAPVEFEIKLDEAWTQIQGILMSGDLFQLTVEFDSPVAGPELADLDSVMPLL